MNESYYNTAKDYPELLELNGQYLDLVNAYETAIEVSGKVKPIKIGRASCRERV